MIGAHLPIFGGVNRGSFSVLDIASLLEQGELPPDEGIVVGVDLGGDEGATVIDVDTEFLDMFSSQRREVSHPVVGVDEIWDLLLCQTQLSHDVVLVLVVGVLGQGRQLWWVSVVFELESEFLGCGRDGHACVVHQLPVQWKPKGKRTLYPASLLYHALKSHLVMEKACPRCSVPFM